ncbi:MAG: serine/threonine protein kinase [Planctomycetes bacterium]|nr:serine/threonine protein kinase [Planctomycetota bacterium]
MMKRFVRPAATERMDAKRPPPTSPNDTHSDQDKYATTHQVVSRAAPLWIQLRLGANLPLSFGRYEIQRALGEGAMAAVYLAQDRQLGRQVAIKVPKFEPNDQAGMKRFFREARAMATLRHPHLCPVYDVGEIERVHYFTMAYIEGGTLADRIAADGPMSCRRVAVLVAKIASALHAAHRTGTVHRDLKPANVMIDQNNEPVVMDFGLAGLADAESNLTQCGEMIGTPAYMSPEQITGNLDAVGPVSDVYSLGAIMYEMLTAQLPFDGSVASVVQQALQVEPPSPTAVRDDIDSTLEAICLKAMSRTQEERFASADELAIALRDYLRRAAAPPKPTASESGDRREAYWEVDASRVRELWRHERFAEALTLLEKLAQLTGPVGAKYAEWAEQEIPKVREQIEAANQMLVRVATQMSTDTLPRSSARIKRPMRAKSRTPRWLLVVAGTMGAAIVIMGVFVIISNLSSPPSTPVADGSTRVRRDAAEPVIPETQVANESGGPQDVSLKKDADETAEIEPRVLPSKTEDRRPIPLEAGEPELLGPPLRRNVDEIMADFDAKGDGQITTQENPRPERPPFMRAHTDRGSIVTPGGIENMFLFPPGPPPRR